MSDITSIRNIPITLDIAKAVQPANSFFIYRGDQIQFDLNFVDGENEFTIKNTHLRVFAKKIQKNGKLDLNTPPLFAQDKSFTSGTYAEASVSFTSSETAGEAGHYALCVMVFGEDDTKIKTAQVVYFDLLENGYAGEYQPSEDYRDEVLDALQKTLDAEARAEAFLNESVEQIQSETNTAISSINAAKTEKVAEAETEITEAKTAALGEVEAAGTNAVNEVNAATEAAKIVIDGWTDQTSRLAKAESAISLLQADKLNRGALHFTKSKLTTATNNATTLPLTLCLTYDCDDWSPCVGKSFGSGVAFFNTEIVNWSTNMHYGFNFGIYSASGNANEIHLATRIANNVANSVANNYISFNKATGKHTLCVSISEVADFAVKFYQDGTFLGVRTNKSSAMTDAIGGSSAGVHIATIANYATTGGQTLIPNLKLSRLKIFNCVLPATKADDTNGIGYSVEDYHNGVDEPPTMQDASATYRALLSLQDYTILNGSTQQVFDVSGNANDATATLSDGGSLKGSNDISVGRLIDFIKGQSA